MYYRWSKEFLEASKKRLAGDTVREATTEGVKNLRAQASELKETRAELILENRLLKKKRSRGWGGRYMRYSGSEKAEIIKLVEQSSLSVRQTLDRLDIRRSTFYNWLGRYDEGGLDSLEDHKPSPRVALNKVPMTRSNSSLSWGLKESSWSINKENCLINLLHSNGFREIPRLITSVPFNKATW